MWWYRQNRIYTMPYTESQNYKKHHFVGGYSSHYRVLWNFKYSWKFSLLKDICSFLKDLDTQFYIPQQKKNVRKYPVNCHSIALRSNVKNRQKILLGKESPCAMKRNVFRLSSFENTHWQWVGLSAEKVCADLQRTLLPFTLPLSLWPTHTARRKEEHIPQGLEKWMEALSAQRGQECFTYVSQCSCQCPLLFLPWNIFKWLISYQMT